MENNNSGMLVVISGPSGAGKGTLCEQLLKKDDNLILSISVTTRAPRKGEKDGVNYFFADVENFKRKIQQKDFLEWAMVYTNYYGTPRSFVEKNLEAGRDVILEIDIQGAKQVKQNFPEAVFIFVMPSNLEELKKRIIKRGSETKESFDLRVKSAEEELKAISMYDYVVLNDDIDSAVSKLQAIISAERCKVFRNKKLLEKINGRGVQS